MPGMMLPAARVSFLALKVISPLSPPKKKTPVPSNGSQGHSAGLAALTGIVNATKAAVTLPIIPKMPPALTANTTQKAQPVKATGIG